MIDLIEANQLLSVSLISAGAGILITLGTLSPFLFAFIYNQSLRYSTFYDETYGFSRDRSGLYNL